jgi:hypothetical protein
MDDTSSESSALPSPSSSSDSSEFDSNTIISQKVSSFVRVSWKVRGGFFKEEEEEVVEAFFSVEKFGWGEGVRG